MSDRLLETKLYVPQLRRAPVARQRLSGRLRDGAASRLTLVSAPAGFGKTTLLAEWVGHASATGRPAAWLSLDEADSPPASFWTYLVTALQRVAPSVGATALSLLREPQPPPIEAILATLINDLSLLPDGIELVLDDYHSVDGPDIGVGMTYLLEHLPSQLRLVIATRADPALPLARLRARRELVEIRAADLRFTPDEATEYLHERMGLDLATQDIATLEGRTEGWIAALQLAALSMQGRDDVAGFIAGFAGDDRYIVDYLVEEVLQRQTGDVRSFLLQTSILDRLSGPLADAVTARDGGRATLESLDRGNLFLVPLDDRRLWYRYHHLFADVLRARLLDEEPDQVAVLHLRATEWFERNGERPEAIRHALAAEDFERAAGLIELAIPATSQARQETHLRHWLEALPVDLLRTRPVLSDARAGSFLVRGETEGVEGPLRDAERWLDAATAAPDGARPAGMVVVDEEAFRGLPAGVAIHRAGQASLLGDTAGTMAHARRALELVSDDGHLTRGAAAALLGIASWTVGDLRAAERHCGDAIGDLRRAGYHSDALGLSIKVADIELAQGRLRDAMRTYERAISDSVTRERPVPRGMADMLVGMSMVALERDDLDAAHDHLRASWELGEPNGLPQNPYRSRVALARVRQAEGDLDGAIELLAEAQRLHVADYSPDVRPVAAIRARALIAQGRLPEAWGWARDHGLAATDEPSYLREFEHITLARLLVAQGAHDRVGAIGEDGAVVAALGLLERLLDPADQGGRAGSVIDILVVQALAHDAAGDESAALASLKRAIRLAEPEGYVRIFVDEGASMAALLQLLAKQPNVSGYARRLLGTAVTAEGRPAVGQPLIEPLSEREIEVLRLLASDLSGPDIARELTVSLATVRTHTQNVYAKLGVNSRRAAVRRADELGLIARSRDHRPTG